MRRNTPQDRPRQGFRTPPQPREASRGRLRGSRLWGRSHPTPLEIPSAFCCLGQNTLVLISGSCDFQAGYRLQAIGLTPMNSEKKKNLELDAMHMLDTGLVSPEIATVSSSERRAPTKSPTKTRKNLPLKIATNYAFEKQRCRIMLQLDSSVGRCQVAPAMKGAMLQLLEATMVLTRSLTSAKKEKGSC